MFNPVPVFFFVCALLRRRELVSSLRRLSTCGGFSVRALAAACGLRFWGRIFFSHTIVLVINRIIIVSKRFLFSLQTCFVHILREKIFTLFQFRTLLQQFFFSTLFQIIFHPTSAWFRHDDKTSPQFSILYFNMHNFNGVRKTHGWRRRSYKRDGGKNEEKKKLKFHN